MTPLATAKELLAGIDKEIAELQKTLEVLKEQRKPIAKLVQNLAKGAPARGRGRPAAKRAAKVPKGASKRTNWDKVLAKFEGTFTLDDLAKASRKKKGTVAQAVQNMKKAKKIAPTGKRGEYKKL